ncbi:MAG: hypothetical protein ACI9QQ_002478 [Myxococcota bacterium]|jgi:hypothetical protein
MDESQAAAAARNAVGLCFDCTNARKLTNAKGAVFFRCEKSRDDETLLAYPPLPVRACHGFVSAAEGGASPRASG